MHFVQCALLLSIVAPLAAEEAYVVAGTVVHSLTRSPLATVRLVLAAAQVDQPPLTITTGADGRFQFTQVPAGKYTLSAERNGFVPQAYNQRRLYRQYSSAVVTGPAENTMDLVFALVPGAVIFGRVADVNGEPVPNARGQLYRVTGDGENRSAQRMGSTTADDQGSFRFVNLAAGRYVVAVLGQPWYAEAMQSEAGQLPTYPLTFYPATTNPAAAPLIELAAGQEFQAHVTMTPVPTYNVVVKRPASVKEANAFVNFGGPPVYGAPSFSQGSQFLQGELTPMRVAAGRYQLVLAQGQQARMAVREVEVSQNNQDIEFGESTLAEVRGALEVSGDRAKLGAQPIVVLRKAGSDTGAMRAVEPDGTFPMSGVEPGSYRIMLNVRAPHVIRAITVKGAALRDGLIRIPAAGSVDLRLVVDTEVAEIDGRLMRDGRGVTGALVVITAKDRLDDSWLHRMDQTDSDGSFSWRGLAPGDYLAFALPEGDEILASDPDYLRTFLDSAIPVTIQGTGKQKLELVLPKF